LILASDIFPHLRKTLIPAAVKIGEIIWKERPLVKGNGLHSGITGNGYLLHSLYRGLKNQAEKAKSDKKSL
jgi:hypothetical protein